MLGIRYQGSNTLASPFATERDVVSMVIGFKLTGAVSLRLSPMSKPPFVGCSLGLFVPPQSHEGGMLEGSLSGERPVTDVESADQRYDTMLCTVVPSVMP